MELALLLCKPHLIHEGFRFNCSCIVVTFTIIIVDVVFFAVVAVFSATVVVFFAVVFIFIILIVVMVAVIVFAVVLVNATPRIVLFIVDIIRDEIEEGGNERGVCEHSARGEISSCSCELVEPLVNLEDLREGLVVA